MEQANLKIRISADSTQLSSGLKKAVNELKSFHGAIIGSAAVGSIIAFGREILDLSDRLANLHERTGVAVSTIQRWQGALEDGGSSVEELSKSLVKLNISISEALTDNGEVNEAFRSLGITMDDLRNKRTDEVFEKMSDYLRASNMDANTLAATLKLLGKTAVNVIPAMRAGSSGGWKMTPEAIATGDAAGDWVGKMWRNTKALGGQVAHEFGMNMLLIKDMAEGIIAGSSAFAGAASGGQGQGAGLKAMREAFNDVYKRRSEVEQSRIEAGLGLNSSIFSKPFGLRAEPTGEMFGPEAPSWWSNDKQRSSNSSAISSAMSGSPIASDQLSRIGLFRGGSSNAVTSLLQTQVHQLTRAVGELQGIRNELTTSD